ncbi:MAG: SIMPL domain-containing protein, partial [Armatimonadota bacterium]
MSDRSLFASAAIVVLILVVVLVGGLVLGRPAAAPPAAQKTGITVTGYSETKAVPDTAYVNFSVVTRHARSREAVTQNAAIVNRVVAAIEKAGITKKDINTRNYSLQPWTEWVKNTEKYRGYVVTNSIVVTVRDLAKVSDVADAGS